MSTSTPHVMVRHVTMTDTELQLSLADGRSLNVPFADVASLAGASQSQRSNWRIIGAGEGIHWPELDEDLSIEAIVRHGRIGVPSTGAEA